LAEGFSRGFEVKAFSRRMIVGANQSIESLGCEGGEISLSWNESPHTADRVLDAALLPRRVAVAEIGLDGETVQPVMARELGAVVERHGPAQPAR